MDCKIHLNAVVSDSQKGFKCGIDVSVVNGGNIADVGSAIQEALDSMAAKAKEPQTETAEK